jgi:hypothetical protein
MIRHNQEIQWPVQPNTHPVVCGDLIAQRQLIGLIGTKLPITTGCGIGGQVGV